MRFSPRSLPHPVLNNGDDIIGFAFQANFEIESDKANYYLKIQFHLSHPGLRRLIGEQKAQYVVHVECGTTLFRKRFSFSKDTETVPISADALRDRVEVNFFICATEQIPSYKVQGAHSDYGEMSFNIRKGDILAVAEGQTFDAEKNFDALKKISSIMQIVESPTDDEGPFKVDWNFDKIRIFLSKEDFKGYCQLRTDEKMATALTGAIVLPVLVDAVNILQNDATEFESFRWCRNLQVRLEALKDEPDSLTKAQKLLDRPLRRTLVNLREIAENLSPD
jgi:hypothetical protein